jgi:D-methionine transport system ATP-binding protein
MDVLAKIQATTQMAIIFITHQIEMAKKLCNNFIVMDEAEIIESSLVKDLFINPQHPKTQILINNVLEIPQLSGNHIYKLVYVNDLINQSILSEINKQFDVTTSILYAKTIELKEHTIGILIISLEGQPIKEVLQYLDNKKVVVSHVQ